MSLCPVTSITVDSLMEHYETKQHPYIRYTLEDKLYKVVSFEMYKREDGSWKSVVGYKRVVDSLCRKVVFYRSVEQLQYKLELIL